MDRLIRILRGRRGQDTVEYALLAAFLSIVALNAILYIGPLIKPAYYRIWDAVKRAVPVEAPRDGGGGTPTD